MRVEILGNFVLSSNGQALTPPRGKVGRLFEALLTRPGDVYSDDDLCELLWPGSSREEARPRLHVTVSRLRSYLKRHEDPDADLGVEREQEGYRLRASPESLDRTQFEALASHALRDGEMDAVDSALALWRGEPYSGFAHSSQVDAERRLLTELRRSLVESQFANADDSRRDFLRAKLRTPVLDDWILPRTRLLDSTPNVGEVSLLSVTAPAGFGKSVFLSQWAASQTEPVAWVDLDEDDNDPVRFWSSVVGAILETGRLDLEATTNDLVAGSYAFLDSVAEAIGSAGLPLAIVLDDFNLITNDSVIEQILLLLSVLPPPAATVAFASRSALAWPTARLGIGRRSHQVTASDLRFTLDEVRSVVGDPDHARRLLDATEGWPVAVIALQGSEVAWESHGAFAEMSAYLVEEVLGTLPLDVEEFLLTVAHLDRFNHRLCDAVTGRHDTAEMIAWMKANQLLILDFESAEGWLRLHRVIGAELRRRADAKGEIDPGEVHRRAASWFLDQGLREESLRYAIRARSPELTVESAAGVLVETALRQEANACLHWLEVIEPDHLATDLRSHSIAMGLASVWGDIELRRRWAQNRRIRFGGDGDVVLLFHDGIVAVKEGRSTEAVGLFERVINESSDYAADVAPDLVGLLVGMAFSNMVEAKMFQGVLGAEDDLFGATIGLSRPSAPALATFTYSYWALVAFLEGSYHLAESLVAENYQGRRHFDMDRRPTPDNSIVGALDAARKTTSPAEFRRLAVGITDLIPLYQRSGAQTWVAVTRLVLAALHRAGGDLGEANSQQRRFDTLLRTLPDAPFLDRLAACVDEIVAGRPPEGQGLVSLLAPREQQVLAYLTTDMTNAQIARALFVSPSTIHSQVSSIYRKLGVSSRHRAVLKVGIENIDLALIQTSAEDI